jgi:CDP-paratose 2-epimerase
MNKVNGQTFNVGGGIDCSISLKELTTLCQNITGNTLDIKKVPEARTADIRIYISDCSKVSNICSWSPKKKINDVLQDIFGWLKENERDLKPILE